ncbi:DUF4232 domain-containing protein [Streptomyces cyaneofuscatus]|uniref:DUF4232 domain-containing protein n=1 Tax=Streptomyces TaxID=1883 RepID=UPI0004C85839|nr:MULTISPECIES: DUF4232 domain-containing protein [Streptomyces]CAD5963027.1 conserved exported protein of unknown function [Streptomyces sp. KY75]CAD5979102.1 conserved exported protein of unknown function [Streptomyces sp. KY70]
MRTNRIRTTALAATALVAALSLTACGGNEGTKSAGPAPAATTESTAPQTPQTSEETTAPPAGAPAGTSSTPAQGKHAGGNGDKGTHSGTETATQASSTARTTCTTANTTVTVTKVTRPINHLLLTLKNTGSGLCDAYYAPHLGFDGAQSVFPILKDSKPQAVVTLAPGEEAYAGIALSGEPGQGKLYKSKNLSVFFAKKNGSTYDTPAKLKLPAETYWDDNGFVTYWQSDRANALMY